MKTVCHVFWSLWLLGAHVADAQTVGHNRVAGDCNAVGNNNRVSCNDLEDIRKALAPALRAQLDLILPTLNAQRELFESLVGRLEQKQDRLLVGQVSSRREQRRANAKIDETNRKLDILLAAQEITPELETWIKRAKELEAMLVGPDKRRRVYCCLQAS